MITNMKLYFILSVLMFTIPLTSFAQDNQKIQTIDKTDTIAVNGLKSLKLLEIRGMKVSVNGDAPSHSIIYHVHIKASKRAIDKNFGNGQLYFDRNNDQGELKFRPVESTQNSEDNMTWIKALLTKHHHDHDVIIKEASLSLIIPSHLQFAIHSKYSNISIASISGNVRLDGRSGKIIANDLGANLYVENNYGNILLNNVAGSATIKGKSATLNLQNIGGNVNINADYSNIDINQSNGDITVQDKSGTLHLSNISGNVTHRGNYSDLYLTDIKGSADVETESGKVRATNIGSLRMAGDYTNVNAQSVNGENGITIKGKSAKYTLNLVKGPVTVSAEYANIELKNIQGNVSVDNKSGSVKSEQLKAAFTGNGDFNQYTLNDYEGHDITIRNKSGNVKINAVRTLRSVKIHNVYGNVEVTLNKPFKGKVHLQTTSGIIQTNLKLQSLKSNQSTDEKVMEGKLGTHDSILDIETSNGKIHIEQR